MEEETEETSRCDNCDIVMPADDLITRTLDIGEMNLCSECEDGLFICSHCEKASFNDDLARINGEFYCDDCRNEQFFFCESCQRYYDRDAMSELPNGESSCNDCWCERCSCCEGCGESYWNEDLHENDDGEYYCSSCHPAYSVKLSQSFSINKSNRKVGFELEFFSKATPHMNKLGELHYDGSIECPDEFIAREFSSHIFNGDGLLEAIKEVGSQLKNVNAQVNKTCGFHVHLDMQNETNEEQENIVKWWYEFEKILFAFVSPSRRYNSYTEEIKSRIDSTVKFAKATTSYKNALRHNRYHALNVVAFDKHGSFEVRLHQGTVDPEKIHHWTLLLIAFFDTFTKKPFTPYYELLLKKMSERKKLIFFFRKLKLPLSQRKYFTKRVKEFLRGETGTAHPWINITKQPIPVISRETRSIAQLAETVRVIDPLTAVEAARITRRISGFEPNTNNINLTQINLNHYWTEVINDHLEGDINF
jgi:hypothetical protein